MLAAATRSRCPPCPQCGQLNVPPGGLRHPPGAAAGTSRTCPARRPGARVIPAASALSDRAGIRCPTRQSRVRWLCRRPALRSSTPRGSPTARVPIRCPTAQVMTSLAASCWACRTRRGGGPRPSARCGGAARHRRDPRCPRLRRPRRGGPGAALAVPQVLTALGADRPPGHQQPLTVRTRGGVGVDDAQVDPGDRGPGPGPARPGRLATGTSAVTSAYSRPASIAQRHRPDLTRRVGDVPVQADGQRRAAFRDRDPQHSARPGVNVPVYQRTGTRPRLRRGYRAVSSPSLRRLAVGEPGVAVTAQHRPRAHVLSSSPNVPGPDADRSRHSSWYPASGASCRRRRQADSAPGHSTTHRPPTAANRTPGSAAAGSRAARTAPCGKPPAGHPDSVSSAWHHENTTHRQSHATTP